jgi:hypothetical protein
LEGVTQRGAEPTQLDLTADEGACDRSFGGYVQGWRGTKIGMGQAHDLLGSGQPLELVDAGIDQGRSSRELVGYQLGSGP